MRVVALLRLLIAGLVPTGVLTSYVLYTLTVGFALAGLSGLFGNLMKAVGANDRGANEKVAVTDLVIFAHARSV